MILALFIGVHQFLALSRHPVVGLSALVQLDEDICAIVSEVDRNLSILHFLFSSLHDSYKIMTHSSSVQKEYGD